MTLPPLADPPAPPPKNPAFRQALLVFLVTLALGLGAAGIVVYQAWTFPERPGGTATGTIELEIPRGAVAGEVAERLAAAGLISRPTLFRLYVAQRGAAARIRPGHYKIAAPITPRALVDQLVKGVADELISVTLPEGKNLLEIAELLATAGVVNKAAFIAITTDGAFARTLGLARPTLEGLLYPDTYRLRKDTPADKVAIALVRRHRQVFEELRAAHPQGFATLKKTVNFGDLEIVTLASIVEKETGQTAERPRIAQVFLNRLIKPTFQPKRLETDPTIVYGCTVAPRFLGKASAACQQYVDRIRKIHLEDSENPYNTYTHEGLPPGPIANPGRAALLAVIRPDASPYLFFVARNDGTHHFSATIAEHQAAVVKYQRGGKPLPAR